MCLSHLGLRSLYSCILRYNMYKGVLVASPRSILLAISIDCPLDISAQASLLAVLLPLSLLSNLSGGAGMSTHQRVNSSRKPPSIPIVPAGPSTVWTMARATKAPRKEDMIPAARMSREGTRRGEARQGSPNNSTSCSAGQHNVGYKDKGRPMRLSRLTVVVNTIVALRGVPTRFRTR